MRSVMIRKLPEEHYEGLRERAVANGRSMEAELRALIASAVAAKPVANVKPVSIIKSTKKKEARGLLTAKERRALKPDAQAALQRLREMFADRKGEPHGSMVESFLAGRRQMWGEE